MTQFFVPYLRYLSFQVFATSVGHVHALLGHLNVGWVLLLSGGPPLAVAEGRHVEAGGKGITLQKGAPCKRRQSQAAPSSAGHLPSSLGAARDVPVDLFWLLCREPSLTRSQFVSWSRGLLLLQHQCRILLYLNCNWSYSLLFILLI